MVSGFDFGNFDYQVPKLDRGRGANATLGNNGGTGPAVVTLSTTFTLPSPRDCDCPFALGTAYAAAGIAVHVANLQDPDNDGALGGATPYLQSLTETAPRSPNVDVAFFYNEMLVTLDTGLNAGPIRPVVNGAPRAWTYSTKGITKGTSSGSDVGTLTTYPEDARTFQRALDHYFADTPYVDDPVFGTVGQLDPFTAVEDANDDGSVDTGEDTFVNANPEVVASNGVLDGDHYLGVSPEPPPGGPNQSNPFLDPDPSNQDAFIADDTRGTPGDLSDDLVTTLSPFDVNQDGLVEDPDTDPNSSLHTANEYTKAHALKHTITHELGHVLGIPDLDQGSEALLMSQDSYNWVRDATLDAEAELPFIKVHNGNQ